MSDTIRGVIPLNKAALCIEGDCETVFHIADARCPVCASENFALLALWLSTTEVP